MADARSCPRCGASRQDASRFCPTCGLDFWQAAAGVQPADAASRATGGVGSATTAPGAQGLPAGILAIGAGVILLVGALGLWLALNAVVPDRAGGPQRLTEAPATHPLVLAFFSTARDPEAAFAWTQNGEVLVTGLGEELATTVASEGRMSGEDWIASMRIAETDQPPFEGEVAVVGRHVFARSGDGGWTAGERVPAAALAPANPFARITTVAELEYVGPETRDGAEGHLLRTEKWLSDPELAASMRRLVHERSRESLMEIHVGPDGVPLSAVHTFSLEGRTPEGEIVTLSGRTTYAFSDWGAIEPIVAPTPNPTPSPSGG